MNAAVDPESATVELGKDVQFDMRRFRAAAYAAVILAALAIQTPAFAYRLWTFDTSLSQEIHIQDDNATSIEFSNPTDHPVRIEFFGVSPYSPRPVDNFGRTLEPSWTATDWTIPPQSSLQSNVFDAGSTPKAVAFTVTSNGTTRVGVVIADLLTNSEVRAALDRLRPPAPLSWFDTTVGDAVSKSFPLFAAVGGILLGRRSMRRKEILE